MRNVSAGVRSPAKGMRAGAPGEAEPGPGAFVKYRAKRRFDAVVESGGPVRAQRGPSRDGAAKRAPRHRARTLNLWLSRTVTAILVLAAAWQLARLTPTVTPGAHADRASPGNRSAPADGSAPADTPPRTPAIDAQAIVDRHLFGPLVERAGSSPVAEAPAAPGTPLNLRLVATVAHAGDDRTGLAIIAHGQQQRIYAVSGEIHGAQGARLHGVYRDRVVVDRGSRLETLRLPKADAAALGIRRPPPRMPLPVAAPSLPATPSRCAERFADALRIDPTVEQGATAGLRLDPGANAALWRSLGFGPGDVLTHIDGMPLDDPALALEALQRPGDGSLANLTVVRDDAPIALTVDTNRCRVSSMDPGGPLSPGFQAARTDPAPRGHFDDSPIDRPSPTTGPGTRIDDRFAHGSAIGFASGGGVCAGKRPGPDGRQ